MSLNIKKLNVSLQNTKILQNINLNIKDGEFTSLVGPSGCGKSTLLKSIAGLINPESGEIFINEKNMTNTPPEERGAVIVFQDLRLFPHLNVEKNITFAMELQKIPKDIQKIRVEKLLNDVHLNGYQKRKIHEMSGGQLQRVALARSLATDSNLLLLDEPFSGLDQELRLEMKNLVKRLHDKRNLTTVLVTHDKNEAYQLSDKIITMSEGKIESSNKNIDTDDSHSITVEIKHGNIPYDLLSNKLGLKDGLYEFIPNKDRDGFICILK